MVPGRVPQSGPSEVTMDENCKHLRERAFLETGKLELRSPFCGVGGSWEAQLCESSASVYPCSLSDLVSPSPEQLAKPLLKWSHGTACSFRKQFLTAFTAFSPTSSLYLPTCLLIPSSTWAALNTILMMSTHLVRAVGRKNVRCGAEKLKRGHVGTQTP